jgi:acetyl esterase/lipase
MNFLFLFFSALSASGVLPSQANVWQPSPGHVQLPIWPGTPPDAKPPLGPEFVRKNATTVPSYWISNVAQPTMTVYSPKTFNTGVAMVVFPGGGYTGLAIDIEGTEICDWLNSKGITGVLVKYRVPFKTIGPYRESPPALEDAQRAISLVRYRAVDWHIDPHKIGVIGFSAGGHLAAATSTRFGERTYSAVDAADRISCRPDFAVVMYPGHLWDGGDDLKLNPDMPVTTDTPATFLLQAEDDKVDGVNQAVTYYLALEKAKVPVEMHLYAEGGHGFGLRHTKLPISEWPVLVERWLRTIGMISG